MNFEGLLLAACGVLAFGEFVWFGFFDVHPDGFSVLFALVTGGLFAWIAYTYLRCAAKRKKFKRKRSVLR